MHDLREIALRRIGIAGGDTSSHAALALDIWGLAYRHSLAAGVTLCALHSDASELDGVEMMLKGGQMGPSTLFETGARDRRLTFPHAPCNLLETENQLHDGDIWPHQ